MKVKKSSKRKQLDMPKSSVSTHDPSQRTENWPVVRSGHLLGGTGTGTGALQRAAATRSRKRSGGHSLDPDPLP